MSIYAGQAATAVRLIKKKGGSVTFTRKEGTPGVFDPVTQITTGAADLVFSMPALGIAPGKSTEFKLGSIVGRKLEELHCAPALGTCPQEGDTAAWKGANWKVIWVDVLDPAGDGAPYCKAYLER